MMRWVGRRQSGNVEDRRFSPGGLAAGGGIVGFIIYLLFTFFGGDNSSFNMPQQSNNGTVASNSGKQDDEMAQYISVALADNEDIWHKIFSGNSMEFREPTLVLFRGAVVDDAIQKKSQGDVMPDAFTHGTSEQRKYWFSLGYQTGDLSKGNTLDALHLRSDIGKFFNFQLCSVGFSLLY